MGGGGCRILGRRGSGNVRGLGSSKHRGATWRGIRGTSGCRGKAVSGIRHWVGRGIARVWVRVGSGGRGRILLYRVPHSQGRRGRGRTARTGAVAHDTTASPVMERRSATEPIGIKDAS